jgi:glycosyltransferase involved in cell wall biosynthesis
MVVSNAKRLRIGVDVSSYKGSSCGIGRYIWEMLSRLVNVDGCDWVLYYSSFDIDSIDRPNVSWVKIGCNIRLLRGLSRLMAISWKLRTADIDIFWSPTHRFPFLMPSRIKSAITIHDLVWIRAANTMTVLGKLADSICVPMALRRVDVVFAVSHSTAADISQCFPEVADKIVVSPLGAIDQSVADRGSNFAGLFKDFFLFVGTLEPRKNIRRLLEAYSQLPNHLQLRHPLVIVGARGWGIKNLSCWIQTLGLGDKCHVLGSVDDDQLSWLYNNAFCLVLPSLYEGFGLPLVEAMQNGTPCLTSNISSMPEVVGDSGLLFDPYDSASISESLLRITLDSELYHTLKDASTNRAILYTWERTTSITLNALKLASKPQFEKTL